MRTGRATHNMSMALLSKTRNMHFEIAGRNLSLPRSRLAGSG
jgi:hypothetical protein